VSLEVVESEGKRSPPAPDLEPEAVFFYDLGNPDAYLIAERIRAELPIVCDWEPVHAAALGLAPSERPDSGELSRRVAAQELLALRLPAQWPPETEFAMRVATYAKGGGKSIAYSLAAFRQAFAGGRDLGDEGTVLLAAAACEMHPAAVLKGAGTRATGNALRRAGERARAAGVTALPAFRLGAATTCGPRALDDALAMLV
jgi:2-hydroxychromene-2-carboxylate isomerase